MKISVGNKITDLILDENYDVFYRSLRDFKSNYMFNHSVSVGRKNNKNQDIKRVLRRNYNYTPSRTSQNLHEHAKKLDMFHPDIDMFEVNYQTITILKQRSESSKIIYEVDDINSGGYKNRKSLFHRETKQHSFDFDNATDQETVDFVKNYNKMNKNNQ